MISNAEIKFLRSLKLKKFRQKYQKILLEGDKLVSEFISRKRDQVEQVLALESWIKTRSPGLKLDEVSLKIVKEKHLKAITSFKTAPVVIALISIQDFHNAIPNIEDHAFFLDNIRDPGNMGSILRSADWFGIRGIYCSEGCVDLWNPKVVQSSMGSVFNVAVRISNLRAVVPSFDRIIATAAHGLPLDDYQFDRGSNLIVIGNESSGISLENLKYCHDTVSIVGSKNSWVESLNAGVSAAVLAFELQKRGT